MKTSESFEEKVFLPSSILKKDYSSLENFPIEENNFSTLINTEVQNFKLAFFDSNHSSQDNSISQLKESMPKKIIDAYGEIEASNLLNFFSNSKSPNTFSENPKKPFFENGQKLWSQFGEEKKSMNQNSKIGIDGIIWNSNEIEDINDINEFQDFIIKKDLNKENNGILNDLTKNLNDINNNVIFIDKNKNNKNINGKINYELINDINNTKNNSNFLMINNNFINNYISLNNPSRINIFNINIINYYENMNEVENFLNFKNFFEKLNIDYICTKEGNNIISNFLDQHSQEIIDYLINELNIYFERIICDKYGNYFFQKLYKKSQKQYRIKILNIIKDYFITVSKNEIGVLAIQGIIKAMITFEERNKIMNYIKGYELELSLDKEGTHLMQSIIENFHEKDRQNLTKVLYMPKNIKKLLRNKNGVYILKRLIEYNKNNFNRNKLIQTLHSNIDNILETSNGCYIIYYLIKKWGINSGFIFIKKLISNFEFFANIKQSSFLIYKISSLCKDNLLLYLQINPNVNILNNFNEYIILKILVLLILKLNNCNGVGKILFDKIKLLFSCK